MNDISYALWLRYKKERAKSQTPQEYYVYTLAYPDGTVFYVGKGTGYRMSKHSSKSPMSNEATREVIRQIESEGKQVIRTIVYRTFSEKDAFIYEWALIVLIYGRENLTNLTDGGWFPSHLEGWKFGKRAS